MFKSLIQKFKILFNKHRKKQEYDGAYLFLDLEEGGEFRNLKYRHFTPCAITGDVVPIKDRPIRFYFKAVGFSDARCPERNWGMQHKDFMRRLGSGYVGFWDL